MENMFAENLGTIACRCVAEQSAPVLAVSRAGGDWQMYCGFDRHDFSEADVVRNELVLVHVARLAAMDPSLYEIADLPVDMGAERKAMGQAWLRFPDADE